MSNISNIPKYFWCCDLTSNYIGRSYFSRSLMKFLSEVPEKSSRYDLYIFGRLTYRKTYTIKLSLVHEVIDQQIYAKC